jgi:hypothetical protein
MSFLPLTPGAGLAQAGRMFVIHCYRCQSDVLVGDSQLLSLHRVSRGFVAYLRCHCGRTGIVEIPRRDTSTAAARPADRGAYELTA